MFYNSYLRLLVCLSLFFGYSVNLTFAQQKLKTGQEKWISLYNGKDLTGWDIKIAGQKLNDNYKNTFRAEGDMIRVAYDQYQNFDGKYGHMYYKTPYSHYILRFEYRFLGNQVPGGEEWNVRNSGIMYHSQSAKSLTMTQEFPVSLEVQLLGGLGTGERHTGNLCTPGTQMHNLQGQLVSEHCIDSDSKTYNGDRWVKAEIQVYGDSLVRHIIEGDTVLTYQKPEIGEVAWKQGKEDAYSKIWKAQDGAPLKQGYIALQAESHAIDFRNLRLLNLKTATPPKPRTSRMVPKATTGKR
ncbi:DUF1080 domain-containing protein [Adhaeribacter arboris]|uniref:DUF1080 domain-containing protein n=1 Tax=Adhaeribacter arboris TaxID=2072846 RepID=A0A2T2Y9G5_9BACT|nr:DUF1080 domain-containing protein [Adhaeribacter arboris]PSR52143.1 DUF1080 domain-containing protein [Adhaeribacter arboris]